MIKAKIGQLIGGHQSGSLSRLASTNLPIKTALRLKEILACVQKALTEYEFDRVALCMELGELNPETNEYDFKDAATKDDFIKRADELLHKVIEIPFEPFTLASFNSSTTISANDLFAIEWLLFTPKHVEEDMYGGIMVEDSAPPTSTSNSNNTKRKPVRG